MNKIITLILCLCCTLTAAWATEEEKMNASDANVFGHVLDKETGEHLPFITVILKGTTIGTTTDNSGHYFLKNLPEGKFTLEFKYLGYKTVTRDVKLEKGKTQEINVEMEEDRIALDGVVVSANRSETSRRLAPTLVNVIDSKIFKTTNAVNLAQGLNFQPGVRVETNCQNCGFQQVRINGLDGPYTQILIDSRPIFSALSGVYGLEQIPANMIDRVEVMRGGGSALFGSSAIAGTINIITKEPLRNSGELTHTLSSIGGSSSFDNNTTLNASLVTDNGKAGMYIFGQNRHRSGYDHDNDGYTELPKLKNQTVGFRSYLKTSTYSKLTFEYHHMNEYRRGGNLLDRPPHEADIAEQLEHSIDGGGLKFDLFSSDYKQRFSVFTSAQNTDRDSYYGTGQDPNAYGKTTDLTFMAGTQYSYSFDQFLFMPSDLTAGLEYNYDHLKDEMIGYNRYTNQKVHIESLFLQNEWKNKRWSFLIGARMDKHNMIDNVVFSPRANVRFNPTEDINIRASYSSGFRAPQAFDEDMHISAVGGEIAMIRRAKDLKEEKSQSLSTSVDFYHRFKNGIQVNFLVEGFYTSLNDVFVLEEIGKDEQGNIIKERRNGSGAKVMGLTLEGKSVLSSWLSLQAGATFQRSRYNEPEKWSEDENVPTEKKMFRTPNTYGYFTATLTPLKHFTASLSGTYTGSMLVQHLAGYIPMDKAVKTPDFFDMNIKLAYDFHIYKDINLEVNAGVQNIFEAYQSDFDQGPNRDSAYIYGPATPRSYFAGIKISY
ncbi:TonB-dependent receptor [Parabacteroides faecis]|uniref:Outer membrane receptor for ferrienterochelin and colicins n=1 Tax=Parabacteroides faecis TaxID=1217282 RepID=A0ABR6KN41_9BACT|nr:TonB-dependent receptor [Parabacteroides faecis]MBB4622920.1 outer membrane receptor for ferrienterochelin and colicins [Parabacteroides faecis]